jgi:hemerythrin-like domain-containing protein
MRRHKKLIPLSREHHEMLLLAQLLKKDAPAYKGLPHSWPEKLKYASELFLNMIEPHFQREEKVLFTIVMNASIAGDLIEQLTAEHREITQQFKKILAGTIADKENVHNLAVLLESHIRKEERQFFQLIQQQLPSHLLDNLNLTPVG